MDEGKKNKEEIDAQIAEIIRRSIGQGTSFATATGFCSVMMIEQQPSCIYYRSAFDTLDICHHYNLSDNRCLNKEVVEEAKRNQIYAD